MSDELDWLSDLVPKKLKKRFLLETAPETVDLLDDLREEMAVMEIAPVAVVEKSARAAVRRGTGSLAGLFSLCADVFGCCHRWSFVFGDAGTHCDPLIA